MATSPLFGWEEPDDTDLVKDGAAAIRTLGNAIDTSMGDLLGGSTGQVLSKASNANMDFTWVTSDDANAIQNAIVDAKGDLIAASAADTPARLAVGGNYGFLQADSAETTGLKWNAGNWTTYTPTVTSTVGAPTTVTATAAYMRIGKMCVIQAKVLITNKGTAANGLVITLPFNGKAATTQVGTSFEAGVTGYTGSAYVNAGDVSKLFSFRYDFTSWWVNNYDVYMYCSYEVA
jgi:hypothetical protein